MGAGANFKTYLWNGLEYAVMAKSFIKDLIRQKRLVLEGELPDGEKLKRGEVREDGNTKNYSDHTGAAGDEKKSTKLGD